MFIHFCGHNPHVSEEPDVRRECGDMKLLKDSVHVVFRKASGCQNREKVKLPAAAAGRKPDRLGTNGP